METFHSRPYRVIYTNLPAIISSTQSFPPSLRASLWSSCVVLPLLALTWMSAVLAMTDKRSILFQILFAVFDSLQGFVIVMVHCILRREVEDDIKPPCFLPWSLFTWIYKMLVWVCFVFFLVFKTLQGVDLLNHRFNWRWMNLLQSAVFWTVRYCIKKAIMNFQWLIF